MTTDPHVFGWCSPDDRHHDRCLVTYTTLTGIERVCECPNEPERHGAEREAAA